MRLLQLTFLFCTLSVFFLSDLAGEYSPSHLAKNVRTIGVKSNKSSVAEAGATNIILQSADGGQTWQDISHGLPGGQQPDDFFAGGSAVYLRVRNEIYRSKANIKSPVWERVNGLDPKCTSIAFNHSGVIAYNGEGKFYQQVSGEATWSPMYTNFKKLYARTIFESSNGSVFLGSDNGLYKSDDQGQSWKQVVGHGWAGDLVEAKGVLIGTSQSGIMRSTDNGETWEWVINEGGVGIAVERIDGGFAAISYNTTSNSRRVRVSFDTGKTWKTIDEGLQPSLSVSSIKQFGQYLICGHPDGIFRSSDMGKTWTNVRPTFDNEFIASVKTWNAVPSNDNRRVFKIYVSGNMLYAVSKNGGC